MSFVHTLSSCNKPLRFRKSSHGTPLATIESFSERPLSKNSWGLRTNSENVPPTKKTRRWKVLFWNVKRGFVIKKNFVANAPVRFSALWKDASYANEFRSSRRRRLFKKKNNTGFISDMRYSHCLRWQSNGCRHLGARVRIKTARKKIDREREGGWKTIMTICAANPIGGRRTGAFRIHRHSDFAGIVVENKTHRLYVKKTPRFNVHFCFLPTIKQCFYVRLCASRKRTVKVRSTDPTCD